VPPLPALPPLPPEEADTAGLQATAEAPNRMTAKAAYREKTG
jgi:hypothetical protein